MRSNRCALPWLVQCAALVFALLVAGCTGGDDTVSADNAGASGTSTAGAAGMPAMMSGAGGAQTAGAGGSLGLAGSAAGQSGQAGSMTGSAGEDSAGASGSEAGAAGSDPPSGSDAQASAAALAELDAYLAIERDSRGDLADQPFATVPLTRADAEQASQKLWDDFAAMVRQTRADEVGATESSERTVSLGSSSLRYYMAVRGDEPPDGRSLFISMHGGGNAAPSVNDDQWRNQISLVEGYNPVDAIWIAPRAPIDDWNMFFVEQIDPLFERLITNMIVFEGVNPNKVYINGYSAGGDAVYQLGPRMAERWAGAGMSAGHPNDATPVNLRNLAFAIHVGGNDTAYDRNLKGQEWGELLDELEQQDPEGYPHQWQVHAGLPHWMNLEDAVSIPFLQGYTRNPVPDKVVWRQVNVTRSRMYWLAVDEANRAQGTELRASYGDGTVTIETAEGLSAIRVRLSDAMMDLDQPVRIERDGQGLFAGSVSRTIDVIARTIEESGDPTMSFYGEVAVELP